MWGAIFSLIGNVAGAWFESEGNKQAAKRAGRSEAAIREIDRIDAEEERARLDELEKQAQPGMNYLRGLISQDPTRLTPEQEMAIEEGRRETLRAVSPGLRGSGRTTTAMVRDVEGAGRNRFLTQNKAESIAAANKLQGMMMPISGGYERLYGTRGANMRDSLRRQYEIYGNRDTANAGIASGTVGGAIGSVGGIFDVDAPAGASTPAGGGGYGYGAQGTPADLGGSLGGGQDVGTMAAMSRMFADDEGRERKYKKNSSSDVRLQ